MNINVQRIYVKPSEEDGFRILVDRLWPRGIKKDNAGIDLWLKEIAPSDELRKWFDHKPQKWKEFKKKYFEEINSNPDVLGVLAEHLNKQKITFIYSAKDERYNNAAALKEFIENYISPER